MKSKEEEHEKHAKKFSNENKSIKKNHKSKFIFKNNV